MNVETYEHHGVTVEIETDDDRAGSPRDWDNVSRLYCWDDRMSGVVSEGENDEMFGPGDHNGLADAIEHLIAQGAVVILPLYLLDHSGYSISSGPNIIELDDEGRYRACRSEGRFAGDSAGWDTSMVGFAWAKGDTDSPDPLAACEAEIETLDQYFTGDVYGYIVDPDGEGESCWGFYGLECVKEEANDAAEHVAHQREREAAEAAHWAERDVVTDSAHHFYNIDFPT